MISTRTQKMLLAQTGFEEQEFVAVPSPIPEEM